MEQKQVTPGSLVPYHIQTKPAFLPRQLKVIGKCRRAVPLPVLLKQFLVYVQLISDFIKSEIGHRTDVAATGDSSSIAVMACSNSPELFDRLLLINPESLLSSSLVPGKMPGFIS